MNVDKLTEIAEWLEAGAPERNGVNEFHMSHFIRPSGCGTACCIAGAVAQFNSGRLYQTSVDFIQGRGVSIERFAGRFLELDERTADELFYANTVQERQFGGLHDIGPQWAARVIRHLILTGRVDWLGLEHV